MYSLLQVLSNIYVIEFKGAPYIYIPFILCTLCILLYYVWYRISLGSQIARISRSPSLTLSLHNTNKNFKFKAFVTNFISLLLFLELLLNLIRAVFTLNPAPQPLLSYNLTESCQLNDSPSFVASLYPQYWYYFLSYSLSPSLQLCILPIVTLLISVLRNRFLDRPYKKWLRIGLGIIFCRFIVCVCFMSIFQTRILFNIPYIFLFTIDYFMYLYYARAFHQLLCSRRNEARIHRREDPQLFRERSYVLSQYRVTTLYTLCVVSLYVFVVFLSQITAYILLISMNSCYLSYITAGYIPTVQLSYHAQVIAISLYLGLSCIMLLAIYIYQILLFVAYFAVCVSIVAKYLMSLRRQKRTQYQVAQIVDEYRQDLLAYSN